MIIEKFIILIRKKLISFLEFINVVNIWIWCLKNVLSMFYCNFIIFNFKTDSFIEIFHTYIKLTKCGLDYFIF